MPPANATTVTSTRTRRSIANIRSRYAGHPEISTVRSWLLDGGSPMNDGFGTPNRQFGSRGANDRFRRLSAAHARIAIRQEMSDCVEEVCFEGLARVVA